MVSVYSYWIRATVGQSPIWDASAKNVDPSDLPLSPRLVIALQDWARFFDDRDGDLADPEVAEEFVNQGFKLAYAMRRELKGSSITLSHPVSGEPCEIHLRRRS